MSSVVFAGPTIGAAEVREQLDAAVLPPAAVGDVLRATRAGARTVVLIDGVFEQVLPVWHKEILWALTQGVHVWGAASMGALRAAELHPFGMRGVGSIFAGFRDGAFEADDEVAILHGPAEAGFAAVTEALVNIRATLEAALADGIVAEDEVAPALGAARAIHYRERTWTQILAGLEPAVGGRLRSWLATGRVDRKRLDALELLGAVRAFLADGPQPFRPSFVFAWTDAWDALFQANTADGADTAVLDELRLGGGSQAIGRAALLRLLASAEAERSGPIAAEGIAAAREDLRARHGLWRRADLEAWIAAAGLTAAGFEGLCREEAAIAALLAGRRAPVAAAMLAELRASGAYPALAARARDKASRLVAAGLVELTARELAIDLAPELARLAGSLPQDGSGEPENLARRLGFADRADLERALLRELLYRRIIRSNNGEVA